ncbi:SGNH/GDSL hydrolase family protein [Imperialibacter roseus]|uniref:SGNH/GDSL hydrolase family protein n=1 Tax=Imperialibacter roseus TaxID=1324217 RepID=A0ABZ0IVE5_9BACT|nr:SGNH/GDSL hydrolase family protein [Imperialibacter roseus]WOK07915.1 SGNH/GDSL hydrolase family protein [Imperialibacter roseus]
MTRMITCLLFAFSLHLSAQSQGSYIIPDSVQRIVFLGNSITYAGQYVSYIEACLRLAYPHRKFEVINVGLPSETVSGLSETNHADGKFPRPDLRERLDRVLAQTQPDLVFASYGMNDGIYLPFDDTRFQAYKEGINWLHREVSKSGAAIVHLTPPVFDERKGVAYANVLDIYSDWLISNRYTKDWNVADVHGPMKKHLEDRRLIDPDFKYASDGVHPDKTGHWIMAKAILAYLGLNELARADSAGEAVSTASNGEKILQLIEERQAIMKDAWLTATGHTRPGMKEGLPLKEALAQSAEFEKALGKLMEGLRF